MPRNDRGWDRSLVSFLFWNLHKHPLQDRVARLASAHGVDVLMLAECELDSNEMLAALNGLGGGSYCFPFSAGNKIRVFTRLPESSLTDAFNDPLGGLTIRRLMVGEPPGLLLAVVHFPSRVNWDQDDQTMESTALAADIIRTEDESEHRRTILVGDLNMNPFEPGVVGAHALHAVMTRSLARREERDVKGRPYRFFYNPMWGCFGDRTAGPPGTYYFQSSKPVNCFWNIYDQVLLRPSLMDALEELRILESDGHDRLLTPRGLPRKSTVSDHLPLFFRLNL
jgi:hypothetical protein